MKASVKRRYWVASGMLPAASLLLIFGITGCKPSEQTKVAFDPKPPDATEVARVLENDAKAVSGYTPGAASQNVVEAFVALNSLSEASDPALDQRRIEKAFDDLRRSIVRCLEDEGQENLRRLGLFLLARFERDLDDLVKNTRTLGLTTAALVGKVQTPAAAEPFIKKFVEIGGDFLPLAVANDLVRDDPSGGILVAPDTVFFIRLAFKVHWANILPETIDPQKLMLSDFEREHYDRWVIERSKTAPLARRLQAIANIKAHNPSYPTLKAKGIVLFQAGSFDEAAKAFEEALKQNPGDKYIEACLSQARHKR
jgi:tetratricopeptide (TPR) repeat protein